jgi:general L-amino acid transport system permease protein
LLISLLLAAVANGVGFGIGLLIGWLGESEKRPFRWLARLYVEVFRGLPLILLVLLIFQLIGNGRRWGVTLPPIFSAFVGLSLYSGAYQAEIVRAGLRAVPEEMLAAARSLGGTRWQLFYKLKIGYAIRVMTPALTGQLISLFKDTSVVIIIGVADLMTTARIILGSDIGNAPYWVGLYLLVGFCYFVIAFTLSRVAYRIEREQAAGDLVHAVVNY